MEKYQTLIEALVTVVLAGTICLFLRKPADRLVVWLKGLNGKKYTIVLAFVITLLVLEILIFRNTP